MSHPADEERRPLFEEPVARLLPHSELGEKGVICAFLLTPREVGAICAEMSLDWQAFYHPGRSILYRTLTELWALEKRIDMVILIQTLQDRRQVELCGGDAAVAELFGFLPSSQNIRAHIDLVKAKKSARDFIASCDKSKEAAYTSEEPESLIGAHMEAVAGLLTPDRKGYRPWADYLQEKRIRLTSQEEDRDLVPTGIRWLDENSPMRRKDMPLVTGPTKAGKSMLAASIIRNVCRAGGAVFCASLEQPGDEQTDRLIHGVARVDTARNHFSKLSNPEEMSLHQALNNSEGWRLDLRDDLFDAANIVGALRQAKIRWPDLSVAVVDYVQLVKGHRERGENREIEVAGVSHLFRRVGMDLDLVMILLCQTNANGDARESKAIDQDVTAKWVLHPARMKDKREGYELRRLEIPFQRKGTSGIDHYVRFEGPFATVSDTEDDEQPELFEDRPKKRRNQQADD